MTAGRKKEDAEEMTRRDLDREKGREDRILEKIKTVVLAVLFLLMIALSVSYMAGTQRSVFRQKNALPSGVLGALKGVDGSVLDTGLDGGCILPETIAFRLGEEPDDTDESEETGEDNEEKSDGAVQAAAPIDSGMIYGCFGNCARLYSAVLPVISEVLGEGYRGEKQTAADAEELIGRLREQPFLCVCYGSEFPSAVLTAISSADGGFHSAGGEIGLVRELYVFEDGGRLCAAAFASDLSLTLYSRTGNGAPGNGSGGWAEVRSLLVSVSDDPELLRCSFPNGDGLCPVRPLPATEEGDEYGGAAFESVGAVSTLFSAWERESELSDALLRFFGFVPESVSFYRESDQSTVYVGQHGKLRIGVDGTVSFSASAAGGISLSSFIGGTGEDGEPSVLTMLRAAGVLRNEFLSAGAELCGGEGGLLLRSFSVGENGSAEIVYDYYFGGVRVSLSGGADALVLKMTDGKLSGLVFRSLSLTGTGTEEAMVPIDWVVRKNGTFEGRLSVVYASGALSGAESENGGIKYSAEWYSEKAQRNGGGVG